MNSNSSSPSLWGSHWVVAVLKVLLLIVFETRSFCLLCFLVLLKKVPATTLLPPSWRHCKSQYDVYILHRSYNRCWPARESADKSLARPGRKQTTANKLGIYATYSPRTSIHSLFRCSNFCKPLKKKIQMVVRPTRSPRQQWLPRRTKNGDLSIAFSVQGTSCSPTGPDPENRVRDKTLEAQVGQFLLGCKRPVSRGIVVQEQDPLGDFPTAFFSQNVLQLHQQRWGILRVDSLALWKIINEEDAVLIPKNRDENISSGFLYSEFFWGGVSHYAATPLIVALSLGHSDITRFRPGSPIATGNNLDRAEKNPKVAQTTGTVDVFDPRAGISGPTWRRTSACPDLHEWWNQPAHVRCPVAQLLI